MLENNPKDKKAVTLCLSGKSSELISGMDESTVDAMIQLFADKENAEIIAEQFELLDHTDDCFRNSVISVKERSCL